MSCIKYALTLFQPSPINQYYLEKEYMKTSKVSRCTSDSFLDFSNYPHGSLIKNGSIYKTCFNFIYMYIALYVGGKFRAGRIELSSVGQPKNGSNIFYAKLRVKSFVCGSILMKNRKKIHKAHLMNTEFFI